MKSINELLKQEVDKGKAPSVQYAFFDMDSIVYEYKYGWSDIKAGIKTNEATTYNLFSVTKTFTALAVLQSAQAGKVKPDDAVIKYLPDFSYGTEVTIAQLLNHTAGIPNPLPLRWTHLMNGHEEFDRNSFFDRVFEKHDKLKSAPGTKFSYSNLGYVLLGRLLEQVSGTSYEAYVKENIFDKAGITNRELDFTIDTAYHAKGYQKNWSMVNVALNFMIDKKKYMSASEGRWQPFNLFYVNGTPYGGIIGSINGLIKYARALMKNNSALVNDDYKKRLFTENSINNKPTGMSFSWFTGSLKNTQYYAHAGGGGGYYVELRIYPEAGAGSVILFNRSGLSDERFLNKTDSFFLSDKMR